MADKAPAPSATSKRYICLAPTALQRAVIMRAVSKLRESERDPSLPMTQCIELICADYLAGR